MRNPKAKLAYGSAAAMIFVDPIVQPKSVDRSRVGLPQRRQSHALIHTKTLITSAELTAAINREV
jgi:hypothetical protein